jgi:hypothetical protein
LLHAERKHRPNTHDVIERRNFNAAQGVASILSVGRELYQSTRRLIYRRLVTRSKEPRQSNTLGALCLLNCIATLFEVPARTKFRTALRRMS